MRMLCRQGMAYAFAFWASSALFLGLFCASKAASRTLVDSSVAQHLKLKPLE